VETVLLIDDDMELCTILQGYLARYGFPVITENTGDAACGALWRVAIAA
jgi:DNA-binding response OmpR family regulator